MDERKTSENVRSGIDTIFRIVEMVGIVALLHALVPDGRIRNWIAWIGIGLVTTWFTLPLTSRLGLYLAKLKMPPVRRTIVIVCAFVSLACLGIVLEQAMLQLSNAIEKHDENGKH